MTSPTPRDFAEQGGAATMNPSALRRWLISRVLSRHVNPRRIQGIHAGAERRRGRGPHVLHFFYQAGDPYSHLAAQAALRLLKAYPVSLRCYLVGGLRGRNNPEPQLQTALSLRDAIAVAPAYGLEFAAESRRPPAAACGQLEAVLAGLEAEAFLTTAIAGGRALFAGRSLPDTTGPQSRSDALNEGNATQASLGHYAGAMFYYGQDWYWGVDRLYHLERRWQALGLGKSEGELCFARPVLPSHFPNRANGGLRLEFFASLRSPYTAAVFEPLVALCEAANIELQLRPVLPMVMRGVSLTRSKGLYIFHDAAREARAMGQAFGPIYDPIGEPVRRCYALFPWARQEGKDIELMGAFLRAAFAEGRNMASRRSLSRLVERIGLNPLEAAQHLGDESWQGLLEENRAALYSSGCWGVPSYRLVDAAGQELLSAWGQDRLWLVARKIASYQELPG